MSRWWKTSRDGKKNFEDYYFKYKSGEITLTQFAYKQDISTVAVLKRIKYYEKNHSCKYETTTKREKNKALKLMKNHIDKIKKFDIKYQDELTKVLFRTCLYIIRNKNDIENEENLIWYSLKRKIKDVKYTEYRQKEKLNLDEVLCLSRFGSE